MTSDLEKSTTPPTGIPPEERKKILKEIRILGIVFVVVGVIMLVVMGLGILVK